MNTPNTLTKLSIVAAVAICLLNVSPARAQANRTWVSTNGDDTNPCSHTSPCKTFSGALAKTNSGGEIVVLNSGGFGPVAITKAITIDGGGKFAGIQLNSTGAAITINPPSSADLVVVRNLTLNGLNAGGTGILVNNGDTHMDFEFTQAAVG